jgi:uncharacterized protein YkwD
MPRSLSRSLRVAAVAVALATLAACSPSPFGPDAPPGADGDVRASAVFTVTGCDGAPMALSADEARTVALHNEARRAHALPELCVHPLLTEAARAHSREMLEKGFLSHDSFDGRPFHVRIAGFGYTRPRALAENAGWGSGPLGEAERIFASWMDSPSHRPHILDGALREVGVGVAAGTYRSHAGARVYTVDFGTR